MGMSQTTMIREVFAENLRYWMDRREVSQVDLAAQAKLSWIAVHRYRAGSITPSIEAVAKLATALNCAPSSLIRGIGAPVAELD